MRIVTENRECAMILTTHRCLINGETTSLLADNCVGMLSSPLEPSAVVKQDGTKPEVQRTVFHTDRAAAIIPHVHVQGTAGKTAPRGAQLNP